MLDGSTNRIQEQISCCYCNSADEYHFRIDDIDQVGDYQRQAGGIGDETGGDDERQRRRRRIAAAERDPESFAARRPVEEDDVLEADSGWVSRFLSNPVAVVLALVVLVSVVLWPSTKCNVNPRTPSGCASITGVRCE